MLNLHAEAKHSMTNAALRRQARTTGDEAHATIECKNRESPAATNRFNESVQRILESAS